RQTLAARGNVRDRLIEAARLDLGLGFGAGPAVALALEVDLALDRGPGEVVAALAQRVAGVVVELGQLGLDLALGVGRPVAPRVGRVAVDAELVLGPLELAHRLAHQHRPACPLGQLDRFLDVGFDDSPDAHQDCFGHAATPPYHAHKRRRGSYAATVIDSA